MAVESSLPFDLTILRSFRVLRPLKLVSKVPSERKPISSSYWVHNSEVFCQRFVTFFKFTSLLENVPRV